MGGPDLLFFLLLFAVLRLFLSNGPVADSDSIGTPAEPLAPLSPTMAERAPAAVAQTLGVRNMDPSTLVATPTTISAPPPPPPSVQSPQHPLSPSMGEQPRALSLDETGADSRNRTPLTPAHPCRSAASPARLCGRPHSPFPAPSAGGLQCRSAHSAWRTGRLHSRHARAAGPRSGMLRRRAGHASPHRFRHCRSRPHRHLRRLPAAAPPPAPSGPSSGYPQAWPPRVYRRHPHRRRRRRRRRRSGRCTRPCRVPMAARTRVGSTACRRRDTRHLPHITRTRRSSRTISRADAAAATTGVTIAGDHPVRTVGDPLAAIVAVTVVVTTGETSGDASGEPGWFCCCCNICCCAREARKVLFELLTNICILFRHYSTNSVRLNTFYPLFSAHRPTGRPATATPSIRCCSGCDCGCWNACCCGCC